MRRHPSERTKWGTKEQNHNVKQHTHAIPPAVWSQPPQRALRADVIMLSPVARPALWSHARRLSPAELHRSLPSSLLHLSFSILLFGISASSLCFPSHPLYSPCIHPLYSPCIHPLYSPSVFTLYSPSVYTLCIHPLYSPSVLTLCIHSLSSLPGGDAVPEQSLSTTGG